MRDVTLNFDQPLKKVWMALTQSEAQLDEAALVRRATRGDGDAFTQLYDTYVERIYRHISYRVKHLADVEDLTQEVFLRAWRAIQGYRYEEKPFLSWLYTIAHNLVVDYYRKKERESQSYVQQANGLVEGQRDPAMEEFLDLDVVRRLLARLPGDQQQVLMLRFIEGLDYSAVATAMDKSEGAVRVIQLRALRKLRQLLEEEGGQG